MPLDAFVVVFIDEAQKMSPSLIEEIRILSDAFGRHGQLQIVFVGQLELMDGSSRLYTHTTPGSWRNEWSHNGMLSRSAPRTGS